MRGPWLVSPALAEKVGSSVLDQLDDVDPASALTCQVCGHVKPTGDRSPMALIAAETPEGVAVVGFAHPACRDRVGDFWPALLDRVVDEDGAADAQAYFALRAGVLPQAVLAFEPNYTVSGVPANGEALNMYVSAFIASGFSLASTPIVDLAPPLAKGWLLRTRDGSVTLSNNDLGTAYTQPVTPEVEDWLRYARGEGRCLVVTGFGLNLDPAAPLPQDFAYARARGLLIAATVRVR